MRAPSDLGGLVALAGLMLLACSAPPGVVQPERPPEPSSNPSSHPSPAADEDEVDALLARAQTQVRGGRAPEALRRELLASDHGDHRHAGRLLQAIAGETPAAILARDVAAPTRAERAKVEPPIREPDSPIDLADADRLALDHESTDRLPELASLPVGSVVWGWFATGLVEFGEPEPEPTPEPTPELSLDRLLAPLPLLLHERPPLRAASVRDDDGPQLVILTSLALRDSPEGDVANLEIAGAGPVRVHGQPLTRGRVRLWMTDAGAVPGFMAARPALPGLAIVEIERRGRDLEIEVEFGREWALRGARARDNGASVRFERVSGN
jgi:hypothetical protein